MFVDELNYNFLQSKWHEEKILSKNENLKIIHGSLMSYLACVIWIVEVIHLSYMICALILSVNVKKIYV